MDEFIGDIAFVDADETFMIVVSHGDTIVARLRAATLELAEQTRRIVLARLRAMERAWPMIPPAAIDMPLPTEPDMAPAARAMDIDPRSRAQPPEVETR